MIYITGDTHIPYDIEKLNSKNFKEGNCLTKDDYVIIAGDFGGVWFGEQKDSWLLNWLNNKPFTTLIVDGNHENFDLLNNYPEMNWKNGKVHKIRKSILHLKRGQVFEIDGNKIFTMGGATSIDKFSRKENVSWWKEELPSYKEIDEALNNLEKNNFEVDYIITHTCSRRLRMQMGYYEVDVLNNFFDYLEDEIKYKHWYFGHHHIDHKFNEKQTCLFNEIKILGK